MIGRLIRYQFQNVARSRWVFFTALFFLLFSEAMYRAGGSVVKMQLGIMDLLLIMLPLVSIIFGTMYIYGSREFLEVLIAQPLRRRNIFISSYIVVAGTLSGCFVIGTGIPIVVHHSAARELVTGALLLLAGVLLIAIFTTIAFAVAVRIHDRAKGVGIALLVWFSFALLYDGIVLLALYALSDYPLEPFALGFSFFNPIDLARIFLTMQFDTSALMGYTGAVFERFFGGWYGIALTMTAMLVWIAVPFGIALRFFTKKDF